ncbi:MAG: hypothetical protein ACJ8AW_34340 [Rhodopila sp.]
MTAKAKPKMPFARRSIAWQAWLMTDAALSRSVRVRSYRVSVRDASRTFRLSADADVRAALKRVALAAVPKVEGWTIRVFTVERTAAGEHVAAVLDRLARREMGGPDFAAALAATLDGAIAVLAVAGTDAARIERVRSALSGAAR